MFSQYTSAKKKKGVVDWLNKFPRRLHIFVEV